MHKDCKQAESLIGPVSLDVLNNPQTGARIVLLGDIHVDKKQCPPDARCGMPVWSYLQDVFTQYRGTEPIDFFLEIEFSAEARGTLIAFETDRDLLTKWRKYIEEGNTYNSFLASLRIYFWDCFQSMKQRCEFYGKRVRFHYSDVRAGVIHKGTDAKSQIRVKKLHELYDLTEDRVNQKHVKFMMQLLKRFEKGDIDYFFRLTKIDKQLAKLAKVPSTLSLANTLRDIMRQHMDTYHNEASDVYVRGEYLLNLMSMKLGPLQDRLLTPVKLQFYHLFEDFMVTMLAPLFDIYTLARMFHEDKKQVIVYAGTWHTELMKSFLIDNMGFKSVVSKHSKDKNDYQCISLQGVPQPWFT